MFVNIILFKIKTNNSLSFSFFLLLLAICSMDVITNAHLSMFNMLMCKIVCCSHTILKIFMSNGQKSDNPDLAIHWSGVKQNQTHNY